jgi:hypothetical protein
VGQAGRGFQAVKAAALSVDRLGNAYVVGTFRGIADFGGTTLRNPNTSSDDLLLTLPHSGIRVDIPLFEVTNAVPGTTPPGRGIIPRYATPSFDPALFAGKASAHPDPDVALALRLIAQP